MKQVTWAQILNWGELWRYISQNTLYKEEKMLVWSIVMFALGAFAFLDSFYDFGGAFRPAYAFLFMLLSLGILVRMKMLMKLQKSENLQQRMEELLVKNAQQIGRAHV